MRAVSGARRHGMPRAAVWVILCAVTAFSAPKRQAPKRSGPALASAPDVQRALEDLAAQSSATTEMQVRISEIPAPTFQESERGAYLARLLVGAGLKVHTDAVGNVIGEREGTSTQDIVLLAAHLDTVFPEGTDVRVRRAEGRLFGPGISDNGTGLAALVALALAMREAKIETRSTILFVADVGEEGEGNLRGMRHLVETYGERLRYVIALDGANTGYATTAALGSRRVEFTVTGPGGHSWSDFGVPNPIDALARGIVRFADTPVPDDPRTTFNVGEIEGGTSVNSIPEKASIKVDLRSESETELAKLETALRNAVQSGVNEEMAAMRARGLAFGRGLEIESRVLGIRPSGQLPADSPLLAALRGADNYLGNRSRLERSSTDANIPLSVGIPAISLGAGGESRGAHSLHEWYSPAGRELGLKRVLLTLLQVAGIENAGAGS
jgi:tripeptide aminopeptidase